MRSNANGKIYNNIFNFKENAPIGKRMADLFRRISYAKKRSAIGMSTNIIML